VVRLAWALFVNGSARAVGPLAGVAAAGVLQARDADPAFPASEPAEQVAHPGSGSGSSFIAGTSFPVRAGRDRVLLQTAERPGERVEADVRRRIAAKEWESGQALPTVAALAGHYQVSPGVIARTLKRLEADGLVRVVPRWGTFRT